MKKLSKAFLLRSGTCFCSYSSSNPHYSDVCILKWFKLGDETEVEAALPSAYWKNHQECSCQMFSSYSFASQICSRYMAQFANTDLANCIPQWICQQLDTQIVGKKNTMSTKACHSVQVGNLYYRKALNLLLFSKGISDP